jgi:hypothetical protein
MKGQPGAGALRARKERAAQRKAKGWVTVAEAAKAARRPPRTIQEWIDTGALVSSVEDHRRHVQLADLLALAKQRKGFARVSS